MPVRRAARFMLAYAFIIAMGSASASAATLIHLTFDEMTAQSSAILLGHCVSVSSAWNAAHSDIVTQNVFEVSEYYKGNLGQHVTLTELGGQVDNWVSDYTGVPRFKVGEEAVLFLWTDPQGQHQVIGLTQGKFQVVRNTATGQILLNQTPSFHTPIEPPTHSHSEAAGPLVLPMTVFKDQVQLLLKKPAGGARQ